MEQDLTFVLTTDPNWGWRALGEVLLASLPLLGLCVIFHRIGRRGFWLLLPWLMALVLAPVSMFGLDGLIGAMMSPKTFGMTLLLGWKGGAYATCVLIILWLAAVGIRARQAGGVDARTGSS